MPNPTLLWIVAGGILCLMELVFPTAFVAFMMGIAALIVAVVSLVLPHYTVLVTLWLIVSLWLIISARRFFTPKRKISMTGDDPEGETITAIPAGRTGRVLYEGNSWRARCADQTRDIPPHEVVYIVKKQGNTLIVLPSKILNFD